MMITLDQAMDKLRDEMAKNAGNANIAHLGEYLCGYLQAHPGAANQLGGEGKGIKGALGAIENYARKNRAGANCVMVDPETGYRLVLAYYGIDDDAPAFTPAPAAVRDEFDLDALLGS